MFIYVCVCVRARTLGKVLDTCVLDKDMFIYVFNMCVR